MPRIETYKRSRQLAVFDFFETVSAEHNAAH
jgi:hypothetical protein